MKRTYKKTKRQKPKDKHIKVRKCKSCGEETINNNYCDYCLEFKDLS